MDDRIQMAAARLKRWKLILHSVQIAVFVALVSKLAYDLLRYGSIQYFSLAWPVGISLAVVMLILQNRHRAAFLDHEVELGKSRDEANASYSAKFLQGD